MFVTIGQTLAPCAFAGCRAVNGSVPHATLYGGYMITELRKEVKHFALSHITACSKADICKILPDVSPTTVEAVLGAMVKAGSIKRIGAGRATRYIKA